MDIVVKEEDGSVAELPTVRGAAIPTALAPAAGSSSAGSLSADDRTMDLSASSREAQERHAAALLKLEAQRRARSLAVPTADADVKAQLRTLGQPITLFGEGPGERRDRLRQLLAEIDVNRSVAAGTFQPAAPGAGVLPGAEAFAAAAASSSAAAAAAAAGSALTIATTQTELFYTPASEELKAARQDIAEYSFARASRRLGAAAAVARSPDACAAEDAAAASLYASVKRARPLLSQAGDDRPLTSCALTGDGSLLATCGWGGLVRVWSTANAAAMGRPAAELRGHRDRVVCVAWHPDAGVASSRTTMDADGSGSDAAAGGGSRGMLVSCSVDGTAKLWRVPPPVLARCAAGSGGAGRAVSTASGAAAAAEAGAAALAAARGSGADDAMDEDGAGAGSSATASAAATGAGSSAAAASKRSSDAAADGSSDDVDVTEVASFAGHAHRLSTVAFHPSGRYVGTSSYDKTWRLWDVETQRQLLLQEGHGREVYALAFHGDGSLVATGDLGGTARLWDLRSGKSIMLLSGHAKQLLALDFSPNGHHVASGSDDNTSIIWELRQQRALYTIPAHRALIKSVKFAPVTGEYLVTASYDGTVKAWSGRDFSPLGTLLGHDNKVSAVAIAPAQLGVVAEARRGSAAAVAAAGDLPAEAGIVSVSFDRTIKVWGPE